VVGLVAVHPFHGPFVPPTSFLFVTHPPTRLCVQAHLDNLMKVGPVLGAELLKSLGLSGLGARQQLACFGRVGNGLVHHVSPPTYRQKLPDL